MFLEFLIDYLFLDFPDSAGSSLKWYIFVSALYFVSFLIVERAIAS